MNRLRSGRIRSNIAISPANRPTRSKNAAQRPPNRETRIPKSRKRRRTSPTSSDDDEGEEEPGSAEKSHRLQKPMEPRQQAPDSQGTNSHISTESEASEGDLPTLENYDSPVILKEWPPTRCKEMLAKGFKNRASADGIEEIRSLCRKWDHMRMLLALALRCSLKTLNKHIGIIGAKRERSSYINFLEFGLGALEESMPNPEDPLVAEKMTRHNESNGERWSQLNPDQKAVFERPLLLALAGLPDLAADAVESGDDEEVEGDSDVKIPEVRVLTPEEEERYRPLYEELVDHTKVVSRLGSYVPGVSDSQFTRRSLRCFQKHSRDLISDARRHQVDFWLIAASSIPPLSPKTPCWVKVYTTLPILTKYLTSKANFPAIFGAVAQGTSVIKAVTFAAEQSTYGKLRRKNPSDEEKVAFGNLLVSMLTELLGRRPSMGMPRGRNPQGVLLKRDPPVRMIVHPRATITQEELSLGFSKMGAERRRVWEKDCKDGWFHFEKKEGGMWVGPSGKKTQASEEETESEDSADEEKMSSSEGGGGSKKSSDQDEDDISESEDGSDEAPDEGQGDENDDEGEKE